VEIAELDWSDDNEAKLAAHGVMAWEVTALVRAGTYVVAEHPDYPDQVRVTGPTPAGRFLTVVLEETPDPVVWRPVTGWEASAAEEAYYWQEHR
jgi:hypothetical protein